MGEHKPGDIIVLPYGIALQALATGVVGAIVDAAAEHLTALRFLAEFGADSWFSARFQTIGKVAEAAKTEAPTKN